MPTHTTPAWLDVPDEELSAMAFLYRSGLSTSISLEQLIDLLEELRHTRRQLEEAADRG